MAEYTSSIDKVAEYLKNNFDPTAASEIDARIELRLSNESVHFVIKDEELHMAQPEEDPSNPEIILFFESANLAYEIFTGTTEVVHAFMNGQFRSDSNLIWAFQILGAFRKT